MATMHDKLPLIGPAMADALGMTVRAAKVDTDRLGTFTGDIGLRPKIVFLTKEHLHYLGTVEFYLRRECD